MRETRTRSVGAITKGFGFRLRQTRQDRGLSQKQLAELVNADVMQVSRYERGQVLPALETAVALAEVLRVSADWLFMGRDEKASAAPEIADVRLYERFLDAVKLDRNDRDAIILLIDGVISQRNIEGEIRKRRSARG
jgi:transcriptional regulator with XRE-family HTH domain